MAELKRAIMEDDGGVGFIYSIDGVDFRGDLSAAEIAGLSSAEVRDLAQARADADTTIIGTQPGEAIIPDRYKEMFRQARQAVENIGGDLDDIAAELAQLPNLTTLAEAKVLLERILARQQGVLQRQRVIIRAALSSGR